MWLLKIFIYFLIFSCFLGNDIFAQNLVYRSFKTEDGLPSNTIYSIFSDFDGFLYIATDNGIVKFDGSQFTSLKQHPSLNSTAHSWLERINENQKLIGFSFGETFIEIRNDSVVPVFNEYFEKVPIPGERHYFMSPKGDFYYTALDSLYLINAKGQKFSYDYGLKSSINTGFNPFQDSESAIWAIFDKRFSIRLSNEKISLIPHPTDLTNNNTHLQQKYFSFKNEIYFVLNDTDVIKIFKINAKTKNFERVTWDNQLNDVNSALLRIFIDKDFVWFTSYNGTYKLAFDSTNVVQNHFFPGKIINEMEIDREGNYWFSIFNEGMIWVGDLTSKHWNTENSSFKSNMISTVAIRNDSILIGNNLGEIGVTPNTNTTFKWTNTKIKRGFEALSFTNKLNSFLVSGNGMYYVNTKHNGINKLEFASVKSISQINSNSYLIGTHAYSYIFDLSNLNQIKKDTLRLHRVNTTLFDSFTNDLWVGYADQLIVHYYVNGELESKIIKDSNGNPILAKTLVQSKDSSLWVGTKTDGIHRIKNRKWVQKREFVLNEQLSVTSLASSDNFIFAGTNNGLIAFDTDLTEEYRFTPSKGIINKEINSLAVSSKSLFLATSNGLQELNFDVLKQKSVVSKTYIRSIKLRDSVQTQTQKSIEIENESLPIQIDFGAISFKHNDRVRYEYRLKGLSDDWQRTDNKSAFVRYFSLPPGSYTFEVFSINGDNVRDTNGAKIPILIKPPFWLTIWFWALVLILSAFIIYKVIQFREKRMLQIERIANEREFLLQELRISQLSTIKAQMNPHFIFNALNSIQNFIFKNDRVLANTYLGKFSDLMRLILKQSNEAKITLEDELKALNLYLELESVRFKEHLSYSIDFDSVKDLNSILIPSMIIQPYVENAIKHGILHKKNDGKVAITFNIKDDLLLVEIKDDGIGRKKSEEIQLKKIRKFESFATKATEKRLLLLNQDLNKSIHVTFTDLYDESGNSNGTLVQLSIPIFKQDE